MGILGGGAGTIRDCLDLIAQIQRFGARVALFGRKINLADDPLGVVRQMRAVADGEQLTPEQAVREHHGNLTRSGITPTRPLEDGIQITEEVLKQPPDPSSRGGIMMNGAVSSPAAPGASTTTWSCPIGRRRKRPARILSSACQGGGSGCNFAVDMCRLAPKIPVAPSALRG